MSLSRLLRFALFGVFSLGLAVAIAAEPAKPKAAAKPVHASKPAAPAAPSLIWRGDIVFARGVMNDIAKQYEKEHKRKLTLQPFSTVSGIDAVANGTADLAGSARARYEKRPQEDGIHFMPVALDAIAPIVHPRNPVSNISLWQLRQVYLGRITNWKDLGGPDAEINLYGIAAPLDGVEFSARSLLFKNGDQRVYAPRLYMNTQKLEEGVALDPVGMGLSTLSSTYDNTSVRMLSVQGIAPSTQNVANGTYPLYSTLYLASKTDTPNQAAIDDLVAFLSTASAKDIARRHQLVPYSDAVDVSERERDRLAFIQSSLEKDAPAAPALVSAPSATPIAPTAGSTQQAPADLAKTTEAPAAAEPAKPKGGS